MVEISLSGSERAPAGQPAGATRQVEIRTGALTKGTRHRRKASALTWKTRPFPLGRLYWQTAGGPRGGVRWKSVGAFLYRAKAKRRKAISVGQAGPQQRKHYFRRSVEGVGDETGTKSVGSYLSLPIINPTV